MDTNLCKPEVQRIFGSNLNILLNLHLSPVLPFLVPLISLHSCLVLKGSKVTVSSGEVCLQILVELLPDVPLRLIPDQSL